MRKLLPLSLVLVATACSVTPEYQRPDAPVPAEWPLKVSAGDTATKAALPTDWRAFFPDPRLQGLIAAALEHNRDMRISLARVDEARALAERALEFKRERGRLPSLTSQDAWERRMAEGVAYLQRHAS